MIKNRVSPKKTKDVKLIQSIRRLKGTEEQILGRKTVKLHSIENLPKKTSYSMRMNANLPF